MLNGTDIAGTPKCSLIPVQDNALHNIQANNQSSLFSWALPELKDICNQSKRLFRCRITCSKEWIPFELGGNSKGVKPWYLSCTVLSMLFVFPNMPHKSSAGHNHLLYIDKYLCIQDILLSKMFFSRLNPHLKILYDVLPSHSQIDLQKAKISNYFNSKFHSFFLWNI